MKQFLLLFLVSFQIGLYSQTSENEYNLVIKRIQVKGIDIKDIDDSKFSYNYKTTSHQIEAVDTILGWGIEKNTDFVSDSIGYIKKEYKEVHGVKITSYEEIGELILDCKKNNDIKFEWGILQNNRFISDSTVKYSIKLEGYDRDWSILLSDTNSIRYTGLIPGRYSFLIRHSIPCNSSQEICWNDDIKKIDISVMPKWHQTWWSRILGIGVIVAIIVVVRK